MKTRLFYQSLLFWSLLCSTAWVAAAPSLKASQAQYPVDQPVVIEFSELPGNKKDWIVISTPTATAVKPGTNKQYTQGETSGSLNFGVLPPGVYEARLYFNYPVGGYKVQARAPFVVGDATPVAATASGSNSATATTPSDPAVLPPVGPTLKTQKPQYALNEPVVVQFGGLPGHREDYITVPRPGAHPTFMPQRWAYTEGKTEGEMTFNNLESGPWEVRLYFKHTGYKIQKTITFTVADPGTSLSMGSAVYAPDTPIVVKFSGFPGFKRDWLSIIAADKADHVYDKTGVYTWETDGLTTGEHEFAGLKSGKYEVRAYYNYPAGGYTVKARHAFEVIDPDEAEEETAAAPEEETETETTEPEEDVATEPEENPEAEPEENTEEAPAEPEEAADTTPKTGKNKAKAEE